MYWMVGNKQEKDNGGSGENVGGGRQTRMQSISLSKGNVPSRNYAKKEEEEHQIDEIIEQKGPDAVTVSIMETWRLDITKFMASSWFGAVYFNFFLALSVLSLFQYVAETYLDEGNTTDKKVLDIFSILELVWAALFAFDWSLSLFLADHRWEHFWSFFAMVDFATIIPIFVTFAFFPTRVEYFEIHTFTQIVNYVMYGASTLRILRALRVHRKLHLIKDEVQRFLYSMLLDVVTMILFGTFCIHAQFCQLY